MIYRNKLNYDDIGGDKRDRTADLRSASASLSQTELYPHMVRLSGLEPPTSRLSGVRSNHLSYAPKFKNLV